MDHSELTMDHSVEQYPTQQGSVMDLLRGVKDWVLPLQSYQQISCGCSQLNACASNLHIIIRKHTSSRFIATTVSHVTTSSYEW